MRIEKVFKREDGTKIKIDAYVWLGSGRDEVNYVWDVRKCEPRKRTWKEVYNFDGDYIWRAMDLAERRETTVKKYLEFVTKEEVNESLNELWEKLKPKNLV